MKTQKKTRKRAGLEVVEAPAAPSALRWWYLAGIFALAYAGFQAYGLVLNLADVFRYFLQADRPFIRVEEELKIVRAYLAIEELRLGSKLRTELDIEDSTLGATIPVLSIQPLVENAVKHGVAAIAGGGFVRLSIRNKADSICVKVSNSGEFDPQTRAGSGPGIGLANVRRRLALCYGEATRIEVHVVDGVTTVGFAVPLKRSAHREMYAVYPA